MTTYSGVRNPNNIVQKPLPRFTEKDWDESYNTLSNAAATERNASHQLRHTGRYLKNEFNNQTQWQTNDNTVRLAVRSGEITGWKNELEKCLQDLDVEIGELTKYKEILEDSWEAKALSLDIARECLTVRDARQGIDLTDDAVEAQLGNEVDVIERIKLETQEKLDAVFDQLSRCQEARQEVMSDLKDKNIALSIDEEQTILSGRSEGISLKPDPTRVARGTISPEEWQQNSLNNRDYAQEEIRQSQQLRDTVDAFIKRSDSDLAAQQNATEFEFRKNIHNTEKAKKELEWQKQTTEEEIGETEQDINRLEQALADKSPMLKLVHTRLENRTARPNKELVRDRVHDGLVAEVKQIEETMKNLQQQISDEKGELNTLQEKLKEIDRELHRKQVTLRLNSQCLDVRQRLKDPQRRLDSMDKTEKNLQLSGIALPQYEKPKQIYSLDKADSMFTTGRSDTGLRHTDMRIPAAAVPYRQQNAVTQQRNVSTRQQQQFPRQTVERREDKHVEFA